MKTLQILALTAVAAVAVYGVPVNYNKVSNTGTIGTGCIGTVTLTAGCTKMANGTLGDTHYKLTTVPSGSTQTVALSTGFPAGGILGIWTAANNTSSWISPNNVNLIQSDPAGFYTYEQTFKLGATSPSYSLVGRWGSDNDATLKLNGTQFSATANQTGNTWTPFTVGSGFVVGTNTLTFTVRNRTGLLGIQTPSGLRVEFSSVKLPEGSEAPMFSVLLGGMLVWGLKRRKAVATA